MFSLRKMLIVLSFLMFSTITLVNASEVALSYTQDSKELKWGPCPAFIGQGCQIAVLHGNPANNNLDIFFKVQNFPISIQR